MLLLTLLIIINLDFVFYNWTNIVKGCLIDDNGILNQQNPIVREICGPMLSHH